MVHELHRQHAILCLVLPVGAIVVDAVIISRWLGRLLKIEDEGNGRHFVRRPPNYDTPRYHQVLRSATVRRVSNFAAFPIHLMGGEWPTNGAHFQPQKFASSVP